MSVNGENFEIVIKNKRVYEFYEKHTNINIESANLLMIDFMDTIFNKMTKDIDSNINSQLLQFMSENKQQIDTIKHSLTAINDNVSKMNSDIVDKILLQFINVKREYIEDVKNIVTNSSLTTNDKMNSLIERNNSHLIDKTSLIINDVIPKNHEKYNREIQDSLIKFHSLILDDTNKLFKTLNNEKSLVEFMNRFETKYTAMMQTIQQPLFAFLNAADERMTRNIDIIKEQTLSSTNSQSKVFDELSDFLNKYKVSSHKGKFGEQNLCSILNNLYPSAEVKDTSSIKASCDFLMSRPEKPSILFENKEYDQNINKEEVQKFIRDVDEQKTHAVFISQYSGISFKQNFQIDIHKGCILIFIQNCQYSADKIKLAVDLIDSLYVKLDELQIDNDDNSISKELLDDINAEYQLFIGQKDSMTTVLRDFNKRMLTQIEEIQLPVLDKYLSNKYACVKNRRHVCDLCNTFSAINKQALSAHKRGCSKKTKPANTMQPNA